MSMAATGNDSDIGVSIVIPVYDSAGSLEQLTRALMAVMDARGMPYNIVFVDDGSSDNSWEVLQELQAATPERITVIQLMRNFGQHNAIMCGLRYARGQYVITMDDDLQNPPEEIPRLLDALEIGKLDLVYGVPDEKRHSSWRNLGSQFVNCFFRLVFRLPVTVTSFRCIRKPLADAILSYDLNFTFVDGLLAWSTQRVGQVAVKHHQRTSGRSGYSLGKLVTLALNLFTNFSLLPLQIASGAGVLASLCGFGTGMYYLVQALLSQIAVPGYASLIVAVLILGGLQLLALGIIGEYIGRVHLNINRKPQYAVREIR